MLNWKKWLRNSDEPETRLKINLPNFNYIALDYMRQRLAEHEAFQELDAVERMMFLDLIEAAITYYFEGCSVAASKNEKGYLQ